jgi:branched-chain amino acid transport system substrate-binding protein
VNASGGLNGHSIQIVTQDDALDPGKSLTAIQALISAHVVAIASGTPLDGIWASKVQAANIPVVGVLSGGDPTFETNPAFYPAGQTFSSQITAVVTLAKAAGATNIADIYCTEAPQCAQTVGLTQAAGKQHGVPNVYNAAVSGTAPNYLAQCVAAQQQHVTSIYVAIGAPTAAHFSSDCAQQSYNPIYATGLLAYTTGTLTAPGFKGKGLWLESPNLPYYADTPGIQTMNAALDKYYPGLRKSTTQWSEAGVAGWASGLLLEDGIKAGNLAAGDTPSTAEITKGLQSLNADTLQGLAPPLTFVAGQPHHVNCWFTTNVLNQVPSVLNDGKVTYENGSSC